MSQLQKLALPRKPTYLKIAEDCDFFALFKKLKSDTIAAFY